MLVHWWWPGYNFMFRTFSAEYFHLLSLFSGVAGHYAAYLLKDTACVLVMRGVLAAIPIVQGPRLRGELNPGCR